MGMQKNQPKITRRYRLTFDVDVDYHLLPIDPEFPELVETRKNLIEQEDIFNHLLVNESISILDQFIGKIYSEGRINGYGREELLGIAAKSKSRNGIINLLDAQLCGWIYAEPVIYDDAFSGQVNHWQVENLENNQPVNLILKEPPPILQKYNSDYLVAEMDTETVIDTIIRYYTDLPGGGLDMCLPDIDQAILAGKQVSKPVQLFRCVVYAETGKRYKNTITFIKNYFLEKYPEIPLSFLWVKMRLLYEKAQALRRPPHIF